MKMIPIELIIMEIIGIPIIVLIWIYIKKKKGEKIKWFGD